MVPVSHVTTQGAPLKLARERMKIIAAYQEVGTYRGAADICGTTHKTVRRVIERGEAGEAAAGRADPELRRGDRARRAAGEGLEGPDVGEAAAADRPRGRVRGVGKE